MKKFVFLEIIFFTIVIALFAAPKGNTGDSCGDSCDRMKEQCKTDCNDSWDWFRGGCNCVICEMELTIKAPPGACVVKSGLWISHNGTDYLKDPVDEYGNLIATSHLNEGGDIFTRYIELDECIYPNDDFDIIDADLHSSSIYICAPVEPCTNYPDYRWGYVNLLSLKNLITSDVNEYTCDLIVTIDASNTGNIFWIESWDGGLCVPCCVPN